MLWNYIWDQIEITSYDQGWIPACLMARCLYQIGIYSDFADVFADLVLHIHNETIGIDTNDGITARYNMSFWDWINVNCWRVLYSSFGAIILDAGHGVFIGYPKKSVKYLTWDSLPVGVYTEHKEEVHGDDVQWTEIEGDVYVTPAFGAGQGHLLVVEDDDHVRGEVFFLKRKLQSST